MDTYRRENWSLMIDDLHAYGAQLTSYERNVINLIASDNAYPVKLSSHPPYQGYMIQEGILGRRPFAGAELHDKIEAMAAHAACLVFAAEHANLQPHSCSQANQAVYHALLEQGDHVLALGFRAGGHLTHGLKSNFSGRKYNFTFYGTGQNGLIDYEQAELLARQTSPKLVVCGSSGYPRLFDAQRLRLIAENVGARLMFDLSHEAGLIAANVIPNPIPFADAVTMSLDKTLRGPFGGMILCRQELADSIDKAVHPGTQSSFPVRKIADAANALLLTQSEEFKGYARNVLVNAKTLESGLSHLQGSLLTDGTDKHYVVLDVKKSFGLTGVEAEKILEGIGMLSSRQTLPTDPSARMAETTGLRLGTAWATSRGYLAPDFREIAEIVCGALTSSGNKVRLIELSKRVGSLVSQTRNNDVWAPN